MTAIDFKPVSPDVAGPANTPVALLIKVVDAATGIPVLGDNDTLVRVTLITGDPAATILPTYPVRVTQGIV